VTKGVSLTLVPNYVSNFPRWQGRGRCAGGRAPPRPAPPVISESYSQNLTRGSQKVCWGLALRIIWLRSGIPHRLPLSKNVKNLGVVMELTLLGCTHRPYHQPLFRHPNRAYAHPTRHSIECFTKGLLLFYRDLLTPWYFRMCVIAYKCTGNEKCAKPWHLRLLCT